MSRNIKTCAAVVTVLTLLVLSAWGPRLAGAVEASSAPKVAKLDDRVAALEKAVLADPSKPKETVLARLDAIEGRLADRDKADEKLTKTDDKAFDELRKTIEKGQRQSDDLMRRLKAVEQKQSVGVANTDDVGVLRRDVDQTGKLLDDLKERVRKLEAKK